MVVPLSRCPNNAKPPHGAAMKSPPPPQKGACRMISNWFRRSIGLLNLQPFCSIHPTRILAPSFAFCDRPRGRNLVVRLRSRCKMSGSFALLMNEQGKNAAANKSRKVAGRVRFIRRNKYTVKHLLHQPRSHRPRLHHQLRRARAIPSLDPRGTHGRQTSHRRHTSHLP
jgi:hypothetical protein